MNNSDKGAIPSTYCRVLGLQLNLAGNHVFRCRRCNLESEYDPSGGKTLERAEYMGWRQLADGSWVCSDCAPWESTEADLEPLPEQELGGGH